MTMHACESELVQVRAQRAEAQLCAENAKQRARLADERAADKRRGPCNPPACTHVSAAPCELQFSFSMGRGGAPPRRSGPSHRWASLPFLSPPPPPPVAVPTPALRHCTHIHLHIHILAAYAATTASHHPSPIASLATLPPLPPPPTPALSAGSSHLGTQSSLPAIISAPIIFARAIICPQSSLPAIICTRNHLCPQSSLPAMVSARAIVSVRSYYCPQSSQSSVLSAISARRHFCHHLRHHCRPVKPSHQPPQPPWSPSPFIRLPSLPCRS